MLVLDSGALTMLARRTVAAESQLRALQAKGLLPPVVPSVVLVESLSARPTVDAPTNRMIKGWLIEPEISERLARRAGALRARARKGSAVDAICVALAEPGGVVVTGDPDNLGALAANAVGVSVKAI